MMIWVRRKSKKESGKGNNSYWEKIKLLAKCNVENRKEK